MREHPVDVGHRSEIAILHHLTERGYTVLVPSGFNQRYDLVIDATGRFVRAQCKTGRLRGGTIIFNTCSTRSNTRAAHARAYDGEADVFLVYCAELRKVYVVPVKDAARHSARLRVDVAANNQSQSIRWAKDFELDNAAPFLGPPRLRPILPE
jgi:hypothetical protein